jgi:hypothetical protein
MADGLSDGRGQIMGLKYYFSLDILVTVLM